jgi:outer membrane lipoprotein-sorting protein
MKFSFVLIPVASALLLSACTIPFLSKGVEQVTKTAEQKAAEQEILKNCTYDKSICQYMAAQMGVFDKGLTMTSKMVFAGSNQGMATETITKMDGQGNMQSTSMKDGEETSNMIVFNKATYIKDYEDGAWLKMTSDTEDESSPVDISESIESIKDQFNVDDMQMVYTKLGEEACGTFMCEIYEMYEQGNELGKTKIWIDTKEHLMRKMEMTMTDGSVNTVTYEYGAVSISEPSPVKEFQVPSFGTGDEGDMPSQADIQKMMQEYGGEE